jgi:hypothetical protein
MAHKLYKVVETKWVGGKRTELDIGSSPKLETKAKEELRKLNISSPGRTFSLAKCK